MRLKAAIPAVVLAGAVAVGLSACGSSSNDSSSSTSPSAQSTAPLATVPDLSKGVSTSVALDPAFVSALGTLKLTPGLVGKATMSGTTVTFPITGGNVKYYTPNGPVEPYVQGTIDHEGSGLSLTDGTTKVELTNFTVDPGKSILYGDVSANGTSVAKQAPLFFLDGRTLQPLDTTSMPGDAVLQGTTVSIYPSAATLLDQTYKTTAITPYFKVGVATIVIATS